MKKDKHITINIDELSYRYITNKALTERITVTNYCYNKVMNIGRHDTNDAINIITSLGLSAFIDYISQHYEVYSILTYKEILKAISEALVKYKSDYCFEDQSIDKYILNEVSKI